MYTPRKFRPRIHCSSQAASEFPSFGFLAWAGSWRPQARGSLATPRTSFRVAKAGRSRVTLLALLNPSSRPRPSRKTASGPSKIPKDGVSLTSCLDQLSIQVESSSSEPASPSEVAFTSSTTRLLSVVRYSSDRVNWLDLGSCLANKSTSFWNLLQSLSCG